MVKAIEKARAKARQAQEAAYYEGLCSIVEYRDITDARTKRTRQDEVTVYTDKPCKLSFEHLNAAGQTDTAAAMIQATKLFLAPDIEVKTGSKLVITWQGKTESYSCSGKPAIYPTHQEIVLEAFRGWA